MMKLERDEGAESGTTLEKRTYVPGVVLKSFCPHCAQEKVKDLGESYLSYPVTGEKYKIVFYCSDCEEEWDAGSIIVRLTVELAE